MTPLDPHRSIAALGPFQPSTTSTGKDTPISSSCAFDLPATAAALTMGLVVTEDGVMAWRLILTVFMFWIAPAVSHAAGLIPVAQTRSVEWSSVGEFGQYSCFPGFGCTPVNVTPTSDGNSEAAIGFLPFTSELDGIVSQTSTIGSTIVTASGSHTATGSASFTASGTPFVFDASSNMISSRSFFSVDFDLSEPTPFLLTGQIDATGLLAASLARIRLTGPGGVVIALAELEGDGSCLDPGCQELGTLPVNEAATLSPGSYTLEAELTGETFVLISIGTGVAAAGTHTGSFDLTLLLGPSTVPALGGVAPVLAALLAFVGARALGRTKS